ncbi:MAG: SGNH/GDSL hydrolase family protein [Lachnospiraceae bacterium]|nr:SGNH/GDSL hydrolase family protein [Lachnospiraceae bacterium]
MRKRYLKHGVSVLLSVVISGLTLSGCLMNDGGEETLTANHTENHTEDHTEEYTEDYTEDLAEGMSAAAPTADVLKLSFEHQELYTVENSVNNADRVITSDGWASTDYVDVSGYYALSYVLAARKDVCGVSFFDKDKQFIKGTAVGQGREEFTIATTQGSVIVPEGAVYARFITYNGDRDPMKDASVTGYRSKADYEAYLASRPFSGLKIACLGDSLTEGDYGLKVGVANVFYRNYPYYLAQLTGATTVNYGYCGITSSIYLEEYRAGNVDVTDADVVILMLGTNLGLEGELGSAYEQLVNEVREDLKAEATLVLVTPPHATEDVTRPNYGYDQNVKSAVEFVRAFAAAEGLPLIDAYADSPIQPENEDKYQSHDGLHMNEAGYEAFAEFVAEELRKILK